jgi:Calcineurin-like phosphoesterase
MKENDNVLALVVGDMHFMHTAPLCRRGEPNWYMAMERPLNELCKLANIHKCPVLCTGDMFDRWNAPAELINFLIPRLPRPFYTIAGQHDLPYHRLEDIKRSALWTLHEARAVVVLPVNGLPITVGGVSDIQLHGFHWGSTVIPPALPRAGTPKIAIHHAYRYMHKDNGEAYAKAPATARVTKAQDPNYCTYDFVLTGDNHISWKGALGLNRGKPTLLYNPGSFMRISAAQTQHQPRIGLLSANSVDSHYLGTKDEVFDGSVTDEPDVNEAPTQTLNAFLKSLETLRSDAVDFGRALTRFAEDNGLPNKVKEKLITALEAARGKQYT